MTKELIRITDEDDEPIPSLSPLTRETVEKMAAYHRGRYLNAGMERRVDTLARLNRLYNKTPVCAADPVKTRQECQRIIAVQLGRTPKPPDPHANILQGVQTAQEVVANALPTSICLMPKENKLAVASRNARCGRHAYIPSVVPILDHMKRSAVDALVCPECFGRLVIGKLGLQMGENRKPLTEAEIKQLCDLGSMDKDEVRFMSKHEGSEFFFIGGRLSAKTKPSPVVEVKAEKETM